MTKNKLTKKTFDVTRNRHFGEKFKRDIVKRIETNKFTVREVSDLYGVSRTAVYNWVYKYSVIYQQGYRQIVEPMSSNKKVKDLHKKIKELEAVIGQKQVKLDFMEKLIELVEEEYGIDILKKSGSTRNSTSGETGKS